MNRTKHIHLVPSIAEEASGPSYSVVRLCEAMIAQGVDTTLAALDWAKLTSPPAFLKTFPLGLGPRRLGRSPAMYCWLCAQGELGSAEILHNHSLWMMPNVYPGRVAHKFALPLVVSPRGTLSEWAFASGSVLKRWFWPLVQGPALRATSCFHATALSEYEDIRRMGFHQPVAVIPNGIDIPEAGPKVVGESRTLLFLGRIHPIKGLDMLLPAWKAVQDRFPSWRLRIVGPDNGGYQCVMQTLAHTLKLARIEFCGSLYGDAKLQAYRDADLYVLPTYSENFGMTVAESLAAGTPAIVTRGAPWVGLEQHQAGRWIETNLDALVSALEDMMALAPESLAVMGANGRAWMAAEFSWPQIGRQMVQTYQWILHGGKAPPWVWEG